MKIMTDTNGKEGIMDDSGRLWVGFVHDHESYGLFCTSATLSQELIRYFLADALVIIKDIDEFSKRLNTAVEEAGGFLHRKHPQQVRYYDLRGEFHGEDFDIEDDNRLKFYAKLDQFMVEDEMRWVVLFPEGQEMTSGVLRLGNMSDIVDLSFVD